MIQGQASGRIGKHKSFLRYLTLKNGTFHTSNAILKESNYNDHIKPWLRLFPRNQILIIDGQGLVKNPYRELLKVEKFLNLPKRVNETAFLKDKKSKFPCWIGYKGKKECNEKPIRKGRKHPATVGGIKILVDKLRKYFIPRNKEFFRLTKTKFNWPMNKA